MKMQSLLAFLAIAIAISLCTGHIGGQSYLQNTDPQVYCGRTLARALALLCFDSSRDEKRTEVAAMYDPMLLPYYKIEDAQFDWPMVPAHKARSPWAQPRGKRYPGVVNECCDKACSINELMTYC